MGQDVGPHLPGPESLSLSTMLHASRWGGRNTEKTNKHNLQCYLFSSLTWPALNINSLTLVDKHSLAYHPFIWETTLSCAIGILLCHKVPGAPTRDTNTTPPSSHLESVRATWAGQIISSSVLHDGSRNGQVIWIGPVSILLETLLVLWGQSFLWGHHSLAPQSSGAASGHLSHVESYGKWSQIEDSRAIRDGWRERLKQRPNSIISTVEPSDPAIYLLRYLFNIYLFTKLAPQG